MQTNGYNQYKVPKKPYTPIDPVDIMMAVLNAKEATPPKSLWVPGQVRDGSEMRRVCAERGLDYDLLTDDELEALIVQIIHEDRAKVRGEVYAGSV